jgi:hypothetical protein
LRASICRAVMVLAAGVPPPPPPPPPPPRTILVPPAAVENSSSNKNFNGRVVPAIVLVPEVRHRFDTVDADADESPACRLLVNRHRKEETPTADALAMCGQQLQSSNSSSTSRHFVMANARPICEPASWCLGLRDVSDSHQDRLVRIRSCIHSFNTTQYTPQYRNGPTVRERFVVGVEERQAMTAPAFVSSRAFGIVRGRIGPGRWRRLRKHQNVVPYQTRRRSLN